MTLKNRIIADFRRKILFQSEKSAEIRRIRVISGEFHGQIM